MCGRYVVVSGGWDNTVQVWDERCGDGAVRQMFGPHVCGDALDVQVGLYNCSFQSALRLKAPRGFNT